MPRKRYQPEGIVAKLRWVDVRLSQGRRAADAGQVRRLLAPAEIYEGGSRGRAAAIGGAGLQTVRGWVLRFNARRPERLVDCKAPGNRPLLDADRRAASRPGGHVVAPLDQAAWHIATRLTVPDNLTPQPLRAKSPEPNPTENVRRFLRDSGLSERVLATYDDILEHG
jgi:hypothetical protein